MDDRSSEAREILLTLYRQNSAQARHYERQRQFITSSVATVAAITLGLSALWFTNARDGEKYVLCLAASLLVVAGTFGFVASLTHHERARLHVARVHAVRRELTRLFAVDIEHLYGVAREEHARRFPRLSERTARVHYVWQALHAWVVILGLALLWLAERRPGP